MNSGNSTLQEKYENEFSEFLIKRIANAGGSLQLQHITGHLSQLRKEVRNAIGRSTLDIMYFLKKHTNLFIVDKSVVKLVNSSTLNNSGCDSDSSSTESHSNLPLKIKNGKGVVVKIFSSYGFIKSKEPIKTDIFFTASCFRDSSIDLTSFLYIGAVVFFHAERELSKEVSTKYRARTVWRADKNDAEDNKIVQKTRKNRETGLYDPLNLESEGIIQNVFSNLGFISVKGDNSNTVFFHKNRVVNYDNIVDLTKIFSRGDKVEFNAHRSSKPDAKARWEATKVWKISGKIQENASESDSCQDNNQKSMKSNNDPILNIRTKTKEMIKNRIGKIYPRSEGAVIKFDVNELADGDSALYFVCKSQVTDIGWEFSEGDKVYFDAVKIKSTPGWKAVLVWTDTKPDIVLPTCLGDFSEFTEEEDNEEICNSIYTSKSSIYMSESSSSSLKSESTSFKNRDSKKEKTKKQSDFAVNKEIDDHKKLYKNHTTSRDSLSSLPASNKSHHMKRTDIGDSSLNKSVHPLTQIFSNWGDSPYPADETSEDSASSKTYNVSAKADNENMNAIEDEVENSSEYASADEEQKSNVISKTKNDENLPQNNILKSVCSIQKFYDVEGKINKVYPRYAEAKSCNLQNLVAFSLNDFYYKGLTMENLELDDLKQILKVGDSIFLNYFKVVDDSNCTWQKVTLAWIGSKPKYSTEMSPGDFIKQNDLSVTLNSQLDEEEIQDKNVHRKFLTSFVDEIPDNIENLSKTESCSEESLTLIPKSLAGHETELSVNFERLSNTVRKMLKKDVFSPDSMVDIKVVSEEIINIILESCMKGANTQKCISLTEESNVNKSSNNVCFNCMEKRSNLNKCTVNMKDTAIQTIITGDIISQNILADC